MAIQIISSSPGDAFLAASLSAAPVLKKVDTRGSESTAKRRKPMQNGNGTITTNGHSKKYSNGHAKQAVANGVLHTIGTADITSEKTAAANLQRAGGPQWGRFNSGTWLGVLGCGGIIMICPVLVLVIQIALQNFGGSLTQALIGLYTMGPVDFAVEYGPRFDLRATLAYAGWVLLQVALYAFLPSAPAYGQRTPAGHMLPYRVNGLTAWIICHAVIIAAVYYGLVDPAIVANNWNGLVVAFNIYGYFLPTMAYVKAHFWPTHQDDIKFSGSMIYDYYMGIELNPRFGHWFDFKLFHNGRPGILAWTLIDLSFTAYQYQQLGYITKSIIIVDIIHGFYVVDFFFNEDWYLRTIDICHDHFGFYLAWGSMVWLPTIYTLQAQWLARYPGDVSNTMAAVLLFIGLSGYTLFRTVNHQKDLARRTRGECQIWGKKAEVIKAKYQTADGKEHETILLCSGWWGFIRHANYMGDLALSYAACAAAGFSDMNGKFEWHILPWTYAIFMTILLIQRCMRDETRCRGKYGKTWDEYCNKVRYRLIPGIW